MANSFSSLATPNSRLVSAEETSILDRLKPAPRREGAARCLSGTRKDILQQVHDWIAENQAPNILWLKGSPGAGKTAVASSLVSELGTKLGARFFFKRDDAAVNDPVVLWRTIAFDLACTDPLFKKILVDILRVGQRDPGGVNVQAQFRDLIHGPATTRSKYSPMRVSVIVLDALDECNRSSEHWQDLLSSINTWSQLPQSFKLLVTSRDQHDIHQVMGDVSHCVILETGDNATSQTSLDIHLFLETRFEEIRRACPSLPPSWPGASAVQALTNRAGGLFVWATTALDFVKKGIDPVTRLRSILTGCMGGENRRLDFLYKQVLEISFEGLEADELDAFKKVVGAIVLAKIPLCKGDIHRFLCDELALHSIEGIINNLAAVVRSHSASAPLRVCHQSFTDFLLDAKRSGSFSIYRTESTTTLTLRCLRLMNDRVAGLKFNICDLETSYRLNSQVPDLEERLKEAVPSHLSYACRFWAEHLRELFETDIKDEIVSQLRSFLHDRVLYWFEVMSLTEEFDIASVFLQFAARWIGVSPIRMFLIGVESRHCFSRILTGTSPHLHLMRVDML